MGMAGRFGPAQDEPDAAAVRKLIRRASYVCTSAWAIAEVNCVFHWHVREGSLSLAQGQELMRVFRSHVQDDRWNLIRVSQGLLGRTATLVRALPFQVPLRAGDAIHLAAALEVGEQEVWTNDRHLLAAAPHAGLVGRSV